MKFEPVSTDGATVSKFQQFNLTQGYSFMILRDVITQLHKNSFNLTPQTLRSIQK
jgi:hypothetical protein